MQANAGVCKKTYNHLLEIAQRCRHGSYLGRDTGIPAAEETAGKIKKERSVCLQMIHPTNDTDSQGHRGRGKLYMSDPPPTNWFVGILRKCRTFGETLLTCEPAANIFFWTPEFSLISVGEEPSYNANWTAKTTQSHIVIRSLCWDEEQLWRTEKTVMCAIQKVLSQSARTVYSWLAVWPFVSVVLLTGLCDSLSFADSSV
ncbi:unnamed protein product [Tetraodon nigroviridis]|uniref:(spotted green pufferfish) hypothetical protein n=1 Tax=Tetraodon nigroviridis TaxID=99883 RepID=Q4S6V1_TETNG|nr:unnamed protein product [Tetraodon nigroviridis]